MREKAQRLSPGALLGFVVREREGESANRAGKEGVMRRGGASKGQRGSKTESRAHQEGRATGGNCAGSRGGGEPSIDLFLAAGRQQRPWREQFSGDYGGGCLVGAD